MVSSTRSLWAQLEEWSHGSIDNDARRQIQHTNSGVCEAYAFFLKKKKKRAIELSLAYSKFRHFKLGD
jgi:hypothetical protein